MKFGDITKRLNGKQPLKEAKPNEDLDRLCTSDKVLLTDDQLGSVAGGGNRFAVPGESFGLTLFLRFSDRCSNPAMPSSATGSGIAGFRITPERAPAGARAHS